MAETVYECLIIFNSNKYAQDQSGVVQGMEAIVSKCGGELLASRLWMERKLEFPIKGQRKGTYWLTYIRLDRQKVGEFNREMQLYNNVLRHLLVTIPKSLTDTLVAHARGELPAEETEDAEAESQGTATASS